MTDNLSLNAKIETARGKIKFAEAQLEAEKKAFREMERESIDLQYKILGELYSKGELTSTFLENYLILDEKSMDKIRAKEELAA